MVVVVVVGMVWGAHNGLVPNTTHLKLKQFVVVVAVVVVEWRWWCSGCCCLMSFFMLFP